MTARATWQSLAIFCTFTWMPLPLYAFSPGLEAHKVADEGL